MTFARTSDYPLIREVVTHPRIWPWVSDDFSGNPESWRPLEHPDVWYVLVEDAGERLGLLIFFPLNAVCWEFHTCMLPTAGTRRAHAGVMGAVAFIWERTSCRRVVTNVPAFNRHAMRAARTLGFEQIGTNRKSYMKNGKLHDQVLFGLSPEEK